MVKKNVSIDNCVLVFGEGSKMTCTLEPLFNVVIVADVEARTGICSSADVSTLSGDQPMYRVPAQSDIMVEDIAA